MEVTQQVQKQVRVRVAMSGGTEAQAHHVAWVVEGILGMKGSSVLPQQGRWDGVAEAGYIVECCAPVKGYDRRTPSDFIRLVGPALQSKVKTLGLTFYVTAEEVLAMEVF